MPQFKLLLIVCLLSFTAVSYGQYRSDNYDSASDKIVPKWLSRPPKSGNPDLSYTVVPVYTTNLSGAHLQALNELVRYLPRDWKIVSMEELETFNQIRNDNGHYTQDRTDTYTLNVKTEGKPVEISCKLVDSYWKRMSDGRYQVFFLYQVAAPGSNAVFEETVTTAMYGANGLWRSIIIPGWGQFHKSSYLKGGLVLGGTAVLVGGIVATETLRQDMIAAVNSTHNVQERKYYADKVEQYALGRNICIGALGALYVYNIVDAIAAPGARRIVVKRKGTTGYAFGIYPTTVDGQSVSLALNISF